MVIAVVWRWRSRSRGAWCPCPRRSSRGTGGPRWWRGAFLRGANCRSVITNICPWHVRWRTEDCVSLCTTRNLSKAEARCGLIRNYILADVKSLRQLKGGWGRSSKRRRTQGRKGAVFALSEFNNIHSHPLKNFFNKQVLWTLFCSAPFWQK